jgi:hypothetical protein
VGIHRYGEGPDVVGGGEIPSPDRREHLDTRSIARHPRGETPSATASCVRVCSATARR